MLVNPSGPHQWAIAAGSTQADQIWRGDAASTLVTSRSGAMGSLVTPGSYDFPVARNGPTLRRGPAGARLGRGVPVERVGTAA